MSTCVLILRYQPHSTNLIELLPQSLRTPCRSPTKETQGNGQVTYGKELRPDQLTTALNSVQTSQSELTTTNNGQRVTVSIYAAKERKKERRRRNHPRRSPPSGREIEGTPFASAEKTGSFLLNFFSFLRFPSFRRLFPRSAFLSELNHFQRFRSP